MNPDTGLDVLLSLDGTEYTEENFYWYKIEASRVEPTKERLQALGITSHFMITLISVS